MSCAESSSPYLCVFDCFQVKLGLHSPTHTSSSGTYPCGNEVPSGSGSAGAAGRQALGPRGAGRGDWQDAQPAHDSWLLHPSQELSWLLLPPPRCAGAEPRTGRRRAGGRGLAKGEQEGFSLLWKFPNVSALLRLYDCSPRGRFPSTRLSYCAGIILSLPAAPGGRRPVLAPPHLCRTQAPSHCAAEGRQPGR